MRVFSNNKSLQISPEQAESLIVRIKQQDTRSWTTLIGYLRDYGAGHVLIFELGVTEEQFLALDAALPK